MKFLLFLLHLDWTEQTPCPGGSWQDIYACKLCMIWRDNVEGSKLNYLQGILKEHENQDYNGQNVTDILLKF